MNVCWWHVVVLVAAQSTALMVNEQYPSMCDLT